MKRIAFVLCLIPSLAFADGAAAPAPVLTLPAPAVEAPTVPVPVVVAGEVMQPGTVQVCADVPVFTPRQRKIVTTIATVLGIASGLVTTGVATFNQGRQAGLW